jgi:phage shock protein E
MLSFLKNIFGATSKELLAKINEGAFLVDVRTPHEFDNGAVKGSVNIPLDKVQQQLSQFKNKKRIIVYCASGIRSAQAKNILKANGFTNVTNGKTWTNINRLLNA